VSDEVDAASGGVDQGDLPVRSGELENEAGDPRARADVQERGGGKGKYRQEHQRLEDQVLDLGGPLPVRGQTPHPLPPGELGQVRIDVGSEAGREG
jgi:hypothetical protein